jgi:hypothetical protein
VNDPHAQLVEREHDAPGDLVARPAIIDCKAAPFDGVLRRDAAHSDDLRSDQIVWDRIASFWIEEVCQSWQNFDFSQVYVTHRLTAAIRIMIMTKPANSALVFPKRKPAIRRVPHEERLDLTHYPKEFVEF